MINCFFWYSAIWTFILILYSFDISDYNIKLNNQLLMFFIVTITISLILGIIFRKNFKFTYNSNVPKRLNKKVWIIVIGYIIEFLYAGYIPLISIAFTNTAIYEEFPGIPIFHVILNGITSFYAIKIFYYAICNKERRKELLKLYIILISMFLLMYYRSMIIINLFMALLLCIKYLQDNKKIKLKHYVMTLIFVLLLCYAYGGIGNIRDGYKWNDNTYIEELGLYTKFPKFIPKQYMWAYSYLTTPLSNLNYNVNNNEVNNNGIVLVSNIIPDFITKRLNITRTNNETILIRTYFNATTGWTSIYLCSGIEGMYLIYFYIVSLTIVILYNCQEKDKKGHKENNTIILIILNILVIFFFFYNTLTYVGTSLMFYISLIALLLQGVKLKK